MSGTVERTLALKLIADVGGLNKGMDKAAGRFKKMGQSAIAWGKALGGALVIGGVERLAGAALDGVKAFREEQQQVRNFTRTVKNMGMPVGRANKALDEMADLAVNLGFDDGDMIRGMDTFIRKTGDIEKATKLNALAMDIARSEGIDLVSAQKKVEAIYNGSARALKGYGIEGKKGMEAVSAAQKVERGKAREWARNHPTAVMLGRINDAWADLVGNLAQGDLTGALRAGANIGEAILDGLFGGKGKDGIRNSKTAGIVNQILDTLFGKAGRDNIRNSKTAGLINGIASAFNSVDWATALATGTSALATSITDFIKNVDWAKTFGDTIDAALGAVATMADNGTLGNLAVIAGALAAGSIGKKVLGKFLTAAKDMFGLPGWGASLITETGAKAVRGTLLATMFLASKFKTAAATALAKIGISGAALEAARLTGVALGTKILAGLAVGLTGAALVKAVADELTRRFVPESTDWTKRGPRPLPQDPLGDIWKFITGGHAAGTSNSPPGWHWVGERGPELMRMRGGEQVMSHQRSMAAVGGGGDTYNLYVTAPVGSDPASVGQGLISLIQAAERRQGKGWRN